MDLIPSKQTANFPLPILLTYEAGLCRRIVCHEMNHQFANSEHIVMTTKSLTDLLFKFFFFSTILFHNPVPATPPTITTTQWATYQTDRIGQILCFYRASINPKPPALVSILLLDWIWTDVPSSCLQERSTFYITATNDIKIELFLNKSFESITKYLPREMIQKKQDFFYFLIFKVVIIIFKCLDHVKVYKSSLAIFQESH